MNTLTINQNTWSPVTVSSISHDLKRVLNIQFREFLYLLYDVDVERPPKIDASVIKSLYSPKAA